MKANDVTYSHNPFIYHLKDAVKFGKSFVSDDLLDLWIYILYTQYENEFHERVSAGQKIFMDIKWERENDPIDEAIKHAEEKALEHCGTECGIQHQRLAGWLKELKARRDR